MSSRSQGGYAMVALLVGLSIMAGLMTVAMPVWKHAAQREKEAELTFRGEQYTRAIALFQRRSGPGTLPPDIDVLLERRFLRKKYLDPITGEDFVLIRQGQTAGAPASTSSGTGGIVGVVSASRQQSIKLYDGRNHYNEWQFIHVAQAQTPGTGGGPARQGQDQPTPSESAGRGRGQTPVGRGGANLTSPGDRGAPP